MRILAGLIQHLLLIKLKDSDQESGGFEDHGTTSELLLFPRPWLVAHVRFPSCVQIVKPQTVLE